jgi:hypothetical protein
VFLGVRHRRITPDNRLSTTDAQLRDWKTVRRFIVI